MCTGDDGQVLLSVEEYVWLSICALAVSIVSLVCLEREWAYVSKPFAFLVLVDVVSSAEVSLVGVGIVLDATYFYNLSRV